MPTETLACPYCNAYVDPPGVPPPDGRLRCPRCGEAFPYRGPADGGVPAHRAVGGSVTDASVPPARRRSVRRTAVLILGAMVLMAAAGLALSLKTVPGRRAHDPKEPLGYLPPDTNVVASVHVSRVLEEPAGREFLMRSGPGGSVGIGDVEAWTGLQREEFDYLVLGLRVDDRLIPRVTLVVQTRAPYDEARIRDRLKGGEPVERNGKKLYPFTIGGGPLSGVAWFAGENTVVLGLAAEDLDEVPAIPATGIAHLAEPIQLFLKEHLPAEADAWAVGHAEHWDRTVAGPLLRQLAAVPAPLAAKVQTLGAGLRFAANVTVDAAGRCGDAVAARALADTWKGDGRATNVGTDGWVTLQTQVAPEAVREAIARALRGAVRVETK